MLDKSLRETASNHYISEYFHIAEQRGLDAAALLQQCGIDRQIIDAPQCRVESDKLARFLVGLWDAFEDESATLSDSPIPRGSFYMMGKLTLHEANLGKVFAQIQRFYSLITKAFSLSLNVEGDKAVFRCEMHSPEMDPRHLFAEINLMGWHRYCSWLIAENIPLSEVCFSYPEPPEVGEYTYLFPGKHVFNQPYMGFSFHKKYLERELVQNLSALKIFMNQCPYLLFIQPKTDFSLTSDVKNLFKKAGQEGFPTVENTAAQLHMAKRTLNRKLKQEGTSFQKIKDLVRRDRAVNYLTRHSLSVTEVAEKIGFSDPAVFARAFRGWTGLSPREYRDKHSQIDSSL